ncbi:MAG: hypothetical protein EAZ08_03400 [Cytophagales bacterium]|nr:MAG: hypothetical protein EAZ08_03400 [Cytophagales bacterium]
MKTLKKIFSKNQISILSFALSLIFFSANAQESETMQTLFSGKSRISGFGSVVNQVSFANNAKLRNFYSLGAEGGVLFNHRFYIGLYGLTSLASTEINTWSNGMGSITNDSRNIRLIQTGGLIGYKLFPTKILHFNINTKMGGGFMIDEKNIGNYNADVQVSTAFFTVNPTINVELNLFKWMQVFAGVGYNFMSGSKTFDINPSEDLSAPTLQFGLSFGRF